MMNLSSFMLGATDSPLPDWVTTSFPIFQYVCIGLIAACAIAMIFLVLLVYKFS